MIKNDELPALKHRAEQSGEAEDWAKYAEALEDRIETPHAALLHEEGASEVTKESVPAHRAAIDLLDSDLGFISGPVQMVLNRETEFIYAVEVRGQASATAHGKQGLRPARGFLLERLNESGVPVYFAIKDGNSWKLAWMEELGPSVAISKGEDGAKEETARAGWPAADFRKEDELILPANYEPRPRAQERLG